MPSGSKLHTLPAIRSVVVAFFSGVACILVLSMCSNRKEREAASEDTPATNPALTGEQLSRIHCASCHAYPAPDLIDKGTWKNKVLPQMGYRFGIYKNKNRDSLLERGLARSIIEHANIFPRKQTITNEEWERIQQFYIESAPDRLPAITRPAARKNLSSFELQIPQFKVSHPLTTVADFNSLTRQYYIADSKGEHTSLTILDSRLRSLTSLGLPNPISQVTSLNDTLMIMLMGSFTPTDAPSGRLIKALKTDDGKSYMGYGLVLKDLRRPVDAAYVDIDEDKDTDIVVCEYGNHTGSLTLFLNRGKGKYERKILNEKPGAIKVVIRDMNNDARDDIVALMAQGDEGIDIYYNLGGAQFNSERILRFSPVYGSMHFNLVDWNKDGRQDIIYVNGDNADYSAVPKPYHGIRIFLNNGKNKFAETYFYPLHGAYKAIAEDFDNDHDIDIAVISFFPDFFNRPDENFVYLENESSGNEVIFTAATFDGAEKGRWITMEAPDIDNDGDKDLILGCFTGMDIVGDTSRNIIKKLIRDAPPFVILRNKAK